MLHHHRRCIFLRLLQKEEISLLFNLFFAAQETLEDVQLCRDCRSSASIKNDVITLPWDSFKLRVRRGDFEQIKAPKAMQHFLFFMLKNYDSEEKRGDLSGDLRPLGQSLASWSTIQLRTASPRSDPHPPHVRGRASGVSFGVSQRRRTRLIVLRVFFRTPR